MADEFIKGLGALSAGGLGWLVLGGWYNTPTFEAATHPQLLAPDPTNVGLYGALALAAKDVCFWFGVVGALAFWVVVPAGVRLRDD